MSQESNIWKYYSQLYPNVPIQPYSAIKNGNVHTLEFKKGFAFLRLVLDLIRLEEKYVYYRCEITNTLLPEMKYSLEGNFLDSSDFEELRKLIVNNVY